MVSKLWALGCLGARGVQVRTIKAPHLLVIAEVVRRNRHPSPPFVFGVSVTWEPLGLGYERRHEFKVQSSGVWLTGRQGPWKTSKADPGAQGLSGF